jgi:hypothetical protein
VAREFHDTGLESQIEATRTAVVRDAILARRDAVVPVLQATPPGPGVSARPRKAPDHRAHPVGEPDRRPSTVRPGVTNASRVMKKAVGSG